MTTTKQQRTREQRQAKREQIAKAMRDLYQMIAEAVTEETDAANTDWPWVGTLNHKALAVREMAAQLGPVPTYRVTRSDGKAVRVSVPE